MWVFTWLASSLILGYSLRIQSAYSRAYFEQYWMFSYCLSTWYVQGRFNFQCQGISVKLPLKKPDRAACKPDLGSCRGFGCMEMYSRSCQKISEI